MGGARQQPGVDGPSLRDARLLGNGAVGVAGGYGEDDLRSSDRPDGLLSGPTAGPQQGSDMENHQQQVCWERFLQKKTIRVLLVESDDSTRQVVSALLRHCMYEGLFVSSQLFILRSGPLYQLLEKLCFYLK
jgi:pseudo-response regulator 7